MKLALAQMKMSTIPDDNIQKAFYLIGEAAASRADLIIFPELQTSRFFPQHSSLDVKDFSFSVEDNLITDMCAACKRNSIMAVPNLYLRENNKYYDTSLLIGKDGRIIGKQKMVHIAQAEQFYEQDYYTPSDDGFHVFDTEYGKIGIVVCFDRHYPESIRTESLMGANLILIPTANTTAENVEMFEWEVRVQAFQNSTVIAMCNRVGLEDGMDFCGESLVVDADGNILKKADSTEQILYCDVSLDSSKSVRKKKPYTTLRQTKWYL